MIGVGFGLVSVWYLSVGDGHSGQFAASKKNSTSGILQLRTVQTGSLVRAHDPSSRKLTRVELQRSQHGLPPMQLLVAAVVTVRVGPSDLHRQSSGICAVAIDANRETATTARAAPFKLPQSM